MNFFKIVLFGTLLFFGLQNAFAENHDTKKNIVDQAKEINEDIKAKQSATEENIASEIGKSQNTEEPLPLNDPFAGDAPSQSTILTKVEDVSVFANLQTFKLVGIFLGERKKYVTLVNDSGEFITLDLFEELTPGLKFVEANIKEATFQKEEDGKYLIMNFKNQIKDKDEL